MKRNLEMIKTRYYLFEKPSLALRGEEGVHEVIISLVRDLERLLLDAPEDGLQHVGGQVLAGVDPLVLLDELLSADLHLGVGVVEGGVEHDDGEGEDEAGVPLLEDVGVLLAVVSSEGVHHTVNLHRLARQPGGWKYFSMSMRYFSSLMSTQSNILFNNVMKHENR